MASLDLKQWGPSATDFVTLAPGDSFSRLFRGRVIRGNIKGFDHVLHKGLFVEFDYSALQIRKGVAYHAWAEYDGARWARIYPEAMRTNNIFSGALISQSVGFSFRD